MVNATTSEFQKLCPNEIESLRLEYGDTIQQYSDAEAVTDRVRGVLIATACLAGCTPAFSRGKEESPPVTERKSAV
jgi:hypothetical protein